VQTTINLDDQLVRQGQEMTGSSDLTALIHEALRALIERERARRLALLGASDPSAAASRRRRTP